MNDEQFQAWLAKHGGEAGRKNNEKESATGPKDADTGLPSKVTVVDSTTITAKDGATITIRRLPEPAGAGDIPAYEQVAETPAPPRASSDESVTAPPNQPNIVTRKPDGSVVTTPNPNYQPPAPAPRTPEQQTADAAAAQTATAENNEKQWNSDHGYGWVTHAQREQSVRQEQAQARADQNVARQTAATEAANQLARDRLQFDKDKANLPTVKVEDKPVNGRTYTRVTSVTPQGTPTIKNYGPDGKEVAAIPGEGEASVGGPRMPTFVRDGSVQALTAYHTALWNDPSLTPDQREKRFQEAVQAANIVNAQWTADEQRRATEQRERESVRAADYNTSVSKMTFMQNGMSSALDFVSKINGSLPEGSDLGGRAFAALLGLNMLQLQQSGINNLPSLNAPKTPPPTVTAADLTNPSRLASVNQSVAEHTAAAAAPAPTPVSPAAPPQQNAGGGTGEPPARGALPSQPSVPTAVAPPMTTPGAPPPPVTAEQAAGYYGQGVSPSTGEPFQMETGTTPPTEVAAATPAVSAPLPGPTPGLPEPGVPVPPAQVAPWPATASPAAPGAPPDYGQPGMRVLPQPSAPSQYGEGQDMPKLSFGEYPALAGFTPPPPPRVMMQPQGPPSSTDVPPAMRRAQIASVPPWRLTPEQVQEAEQNGWLDDAMRIPGMA